MDQICGKARDFQASRIADDERKHTVLTALLKSEIYMRLCSLVAPAKPCEKTFEKIVQVLK